MTSQNAVLKMNDPGGSDLPPDGAGNGGRTVIDTRFGPIEFATENALYLPRGLLGFLDHHEFGLAPLPNPGLEQFMLLQSYTDYELSFVVAPLNRDGETIAEEDIEDACTALSVDPAGAAVLLVVSTKRLGAMTQISVNLRAPLIVDVKAQKGWQQVLLNSRYAVRHVIGEVPQNSEG